jgi:alkanesulfonate monooxygenase SsuD/methylene tetrahydromethanopterin reductase-like flavin-dependent oxidoreductase (luciferase family)
VRFAISIPQYVADGTFDPAAMRRYLARAEELGYAGAWTQEQVLGTVPHLGPVETLTFAAACTERMQLGCAVFITSLHSPVHLAKSLSTLDQISRGRLEVGVGIGGRNRMFSAFAVDPETFVARFNEGLRLMRALWTEPRVNFTGRFWQLDGAAMEPKPFQKPGSQTTAQFAQQVQIVRDELAQQHRDPAGFSLGKRVYIAVDDDPGRAHDRMAAALDRLYGSFGLRDMTPVSVFGPPDACVRGLRDVAAAGAELILVNPLFDDEEQMERLAGEVIPQLS